MKEVSKMTAWVACLHLIILGNLQTKQKQKNYLANTPLSVLEAMLLAQNLELIKGETK
jgi:hypothetical protein